ncbi:MAG: DUF11 domain-containing protein, partial [Okeania sp. SIO2D1]|nr:DUF11 domain-containing protein [Okeania sp. SIO2D1]
QTVDTTTTGSDGTYSFTDVEPGNYEVVQTNLPGYQDVSEVDGGNDGGDDTDNGNNNIVNNIPVILTPGENDTGNDFVDELQVPLLSLIKSGSYIDVGGDGLNPGDQLNYTFDVTNDGNVLITGVTINEVSFDLPGPITITAPADTDLSPGETQQWTGTYTLTQADIDGLVADPVVDNVATATGNDPNGDPVESPEDPAEIPLDDLIPGSISGTVTDDDDNPLENVPIELFDEDGNSVGTTTTGPDGTYSFTDVEPGNYNVVETNLPGYQDVSEVDGGDDGDNPDNGFVNNIPVTVDPGEHDTGNNFVDRQQADLSVVKTVDDDTPNVGDDITFTIELNNAGPSDATNVDVEDLLPAGLSYVSDTTTEGTYDEVTGIWDVGTVENGDTETLTITATVTSAEAIENIAQVTASDQFDPDSTPDNDVPEEDDQDSATVTPLPVIPSPGVRTPGFWQNNKWQKFWDGIEGNEPSQAGQPDFPDGDLFYPPYTNSEEPGKVLDPVTGEYQTGILIGDYNRNGKTDEDESTIFYTTEEALDIIKASNKVQQDKRYTLGRSLNASWLNYLAGNPAPTDDITDGIQWLQTLTPDEDGDGKGDGALEDLVAGIDSPPIAASSGFWNSGINGPISSLPSPYDQNIGMEGALPLPAGNDIHGILDDYNNNGL